MSNVFPLDREKTYRQTGVGTTPQDTPGSGVVVVANVGPQFDPSTGTTQIPTADGGISISFGEPRTEKKTKDFNDNLAEQLSDSELSTIAEKLLMGIEADNNSRSAWLENMAQGISLLGLETAKVTRGNATVNTGSSEGVSNVDHPLLLEAVLRFQANARGELLPADGPVKVRNDGEGNALADLLSDALEKDMNHYLTKTAKEYYPDTDRMLLQLGFCGISFKKGYHDPIKRRPVIASIDAKDLIVSNTATDIDGAGRVTHRIMMRPAVLKRMQLLGAYCNYDLPLAPINPIKNPVDAKIDQIQGLAPPSYVEQDDQDRELYECYCEIEVPGFEHKMDGKETGLPLPYKVTIEKESRKILEIRRNWHEDDEFCLPRNRIIAYIFIPGLGFYGIGLLNVLGNATKAVTAAWRLMIDAGMFSNFPGFLYVKSLAKQMTNQFRVPPGGGMPIDTVGNDIRASVMPLPYKDPSAVFIQLIDNIATTARAVGGITEMQVGEGKQDAPVGTTLALIEQATKLMSAVHKRLHQAQGQEFDMLKSLLMEDPEALWRHNKKSKVLQLLVQQYGQQPVVDALEQADDRKHQLFLAALSDCELVPRADPNTSSQTERYLKIVAMRQMAASNDSIDMNKVDERAFRIMGVDDPQTMFRPPPVGPQPPPPEQIMAQATATAAQAKLLDSQTKAKDVGLKAMKLQMDSGIALKDIRSKQQIASLGIAKELVIHNDKHGHDKNKLHQEGLHRQADRVHGLALANMNNQANAEAAQRDRTHNAGLALMDQQFAARNAAMDQVAADRAAALDRSHQVLTQRLDQAHQKSMSESEQAHQLKVAKKKGVA